MNIWNFSKIQDALYDEACSNFNFIVALNDGDEKLATDILFQHSKDDDLVFSIVNTLFGDVK